MKRIQLLAAEIFAYSYDKYADRLGIRHQRFETYMPSDARNLEKAETEGWDDKRLAKALEMDVAEIPAWRKRYRDAKEIIDAPTPAEAFRNGVRQSIEREFQHRQIPEAEIESLVTQICFRAADLSYLLRTRGEQLEQYSKELRRED